MSDKTLTLGVREVVGTEQVPARPGANTFKGGGVVPPSQGKLEEETSISFFKNKRTPFKGKDVENLFRLEISSSSFSLPLPHLFSFCIHARCA